jgi:hypothetical protein
MGEDWEGTEASEGCGSCKAHYVGLRPQEDRGGTAGTMGEGESGKEVSCFGCQPCS